MLSDAQWAAIQDATYHVINRESDYEEIDHGSVVVRRTPGQSVDILIRSNSWDLEPCEEDMPPADQP